MGEAQNGPFQFSFHASLKIDFQGSRVTCDGGLVLVRELDERLGFGELIEQYLTDSRAKNVRLPLADLLRQSVYSRLAGYEDVNDAPSVPGFQISISMSRTPPTDVAFGGGQEYVIGRRGVDNGNSG